MPASANDNRRGFMGQMWRVIICAIFFIAILFLSFISNKPNNYFLQEGDAAPEIIYATKQVTDPSATKALIDSTRDAVPATFQKDDTLSVKTAGNVDNFFVECLQVRRVAMNLYDRQPHITDSYQLNETDMETVKKGMSLLFSDDEIYMLMNLNESEILKARSLCVSGTDALLKEGLRDDYVSVKREELLLRFKDEENFSEDMLALSEKCLRGYLRANVIYDEAKTNEARDQAAKTVAPVVIDKGQPIVLKDEAITQNHLQMMNELGLIGNSRTDYQSYAAQFVLMLGLCFMLVMHIWRFESRILKKFSTAVLFYVIILLTLVACLMMDRTGLPLMPIYLGIMLLSVLTSPRAAMIAHIFIVLALSFMAEPLPGYYVIVTIAAGLVGTYTMTNFSSRYSIIVWGVTIGVSGAVLSMAAGMMMVNDITQCLRLAGYSFATALICTIICLGTLPLWERIFDVLTPAKLMEISSNDQPLIKSLMMEAPGTYHHSLIVANLAGQACEAIGANSLLARAGALYHDVGKLKNPLYFKENQIGADNPHDKLPPDESAAILRNHVKEGVTLAMKNRAPRAIIDIIAQHHGGAVMQYFHARALAQGISADPKDYSYIGPKPQTAEAAVVMLADTVEAAVRADAGQSLADMETRIHKLIHARLEEGQLSDCPLTFGNLVAIQKAFMSVFYGMKHERVEYPK